MEYLISLLAPIVATIAGTITGTELFKRIWPDVPARVVTYAVWVLAIGIVYIILNLLPLWLVIALLLISSGLYSQVLKPPIQWILGSREERNRPIGGGGGGPR